MLELVGFRLPAHRRDARIVVDDKQADAHVLRERINIASRDRRPRREGVRRMMEPSYPASHPLRWLTPSTARLRTGTPCQSSAEVDWPTSGRHPDARNYSTPLGEASSVSSGLLSSDVAIRRRL